MSKFYFTIRAIVRIYLKAFYQYKIYGLKHIPKSGSVILVSNHISNYDPPVLGCSIERQVHFMAKEELFKNSIISKFLKGLGAFPIKRGSNDLKAFKAGLELLKEGKVMGVFPEGTRSKDGKMGKGLPGAALYALKTDATVIPVGIVSNYKWFQPILIRFGEPVSLEHFKKEKTSQELLNETIAHIMEQIQKQVDELKKS